TAISEIYTLSLHDALPISNRTMLKWFAGSETVVQVGNLWDVEAFYQSAGRMLRNSVHTICSLTSQGSTSQPRERLDFRIGTGRRSEEHTSELQSRGHLVCR